MVDSRSILGGGNITLLFEEGMEGTNLGEDDGRILVVGAKANANNSLVGRRDAVVATAIWLRRDLIVIGFCALVVWCFRGRSVCSSW